VLLRSSDFPGDDLLPLARKFFWSLGLHRVGELSAFSLSLSPFFDVHYWCRPMWRSSIIHLFVEAVRFAALQTQKSFFFPSFSITRPFPRLRGRKSVSLCFFRVLSPSVLGPYPLGRITSRPFFPSRRDLSSFSFRQINSAPAPKTSFSSFLRRQPRFSFTMILTALFPGGTFQSSSGFLPSSPVPDRRACSNFCFLRVGPLRSVWYKCFTLPLFLNFFFEVSSSAHV